MSFGPIMRFKVDELHIELSPLNKETVGEFVNPGMQQRSITQYIEMNFAPVFEDEIDWYEKTRTDRSCLVWGIWVIDADGAKTLIGNSALTQMNRGHMRRAVSGSMIFRKEYWGKGIASAAHKARLWYAFQHMGLYVITSAVIEGNKGSFKALSRCGYYHTHTERNVKFVDGSLRHAYHLECLNPNESFWSRWWGSDAPSKDALSARNITNEAMVWAAKNVELP
mgnify:CR=1 FL=1